MPVSYSTSPTWDGAEMVQMRKKDNLSNNLLEVSKLNTLTQEISLSLLIL